jgi:hypothetical protein
MDPNPHHLWKLVPDPHKRRKLDPDPHKKVMRIRITACNQPVLQIGASKEI